MFLINSKTKISWAKTQTKIMQDLLQKTLYIADLEIGREEIPLLCSFLKHKDVSISVLFICRSYEVNDTMYLDQKVFRNHYLVEELHCW